jgi:hypothetical protein
VRRLPLDLFPTCSKILQEHDEHSAAPPNLYRPDIVDRWSASYFHDGVCGNVYGHTITLYRLDSKRFSLQPELLVAEHE